MNVGSPDTEDTLEFRTTAAVVRLLPTGLLLIFLGLLIFALTELDRDSWTLTGILLCWATGAGLVGVSLWRWSHPGRPLFVLAPDGIRYRIPWVRQIRIPWSEIRGVDTVDIAALRNVTVVLLSKRFYDSRIFVDSPFLRGPGWEANFIPKGPLVQMALHHELVSVDARTLREAVETRWLAFRDGVRPLPKSNIVAMGESARAVSPWEVAKILVPLIGIAAMLTNLAGLWSLPGQAQVRETRAKARDERNYWEDAARQRKEESRKLEAEDKERRKALDEDLRRMFGR